MRFYVAGLQFNPLAMMQISQMKAGDTVQLIPEPTNQYDPHALRVDFKKVKLGYVPRTLNQQVDPGLATVIKVDPAAKSHMRVEIWSGPDPALDSHPQDGPPQPRPEDLA